MAEVTRPPRRFPSDAEPRLRRLRRLAWWLDRCIGIGPRGRFGLDPLLGLIPGLGDWAGAALSFYVVYEAMRLGLPWPVLGRMVGNVAIEAVLGSVPVAGDVFDFFWQANTRNLRLVDRHYHPRLRPRPLKAVAAFVAVLALTMIVLLIAAIACAVWIGRELWQLIVS
jgi:hypothetical protein